MLNLLVRQMPLFSNTWTSTQSDLAAPLQIRTDRTGNGHFRFTKFYFEDSKGASILAARSGDDTIFVLEYVADKSVSLGRVAVAITIYSLLGQQLCTLYSVFSGNTFTRISTCGQFKCFVPRLPLAPGGYKADLWSDAGGEVIDWIRDAVTFEVADGDFFGTGRMPNISVHGPFLVSHQWTHSESNQSHAN